MSRKEEQSQKDKEFADLEEAHKMELCRVPPVHKPKLKLVKDQEEDVKELTSEEEAALAAIEDEEYTETIEVFCNTGKKPLTVVELMCALAQLQPDQHVMIRMARMSDEGEGDDHYEVEIEEIKEMIDNDGGMHYLLEGRDE